MNRVTLLLAALAVAGSAIFAGCEGSTGRESEGMLRAEDVTPTLHSLPFRTQIATITPPKGDDAAFLGTAKRGGVVVRFSIAVGQVPVPLKGLGTGRAVGEGTLGFSFNTDGNYVHAFKTGTEWYKASDMATEIEEQLCKKVSGEPCPV